MRPQSKLSLVIVAAKLTVFFMSRRSTGRSSLQHFRFAFGPAIVVVATIVVIAVAAVVCPGLESDGNGANSKLIIV